MRYYTGVGSRDITQLEKQRLIQVAEALALKGYTCRSGGADGSDASLQEGACNVDPSLTQIWLPWEGFKRQELSADKYKGSKYYVPTEEMFDKARFFYEDTGIISWYGKMKPLARKFHGRNYYQVYGSQEEVLSSVTIYCSNEDVNKKDGVSGGTRSAVEISRYHGIPTYNIRIPEQWEKLRRLLKI